MITFNRSWIPIFLNNHPGKSNLAAALACSLNWLNKREEMAKIISDKYTSKDSPIFTGRYTVSNPKASNQKPIKVNITNHIKICPIFAD